MKKHPEATVEGLVVQHDGAKYGAVAQKDYICRVYHFVSIWNQSLQEYLPLLQVEREYLRAKGPQALTPVRSKRAARRRAKQYLRIWTDNQTQSGA